MPGTYHGLAADNITIDGIDVELYSADGYVYIHMVDLAAAKLLRENANKMVELGLTPNQLYTKDGLIHVKRGGLTADEVAVLTAKVSTLMDAVQVSVSLGDMFTLGNAGVAVLYVEIGGFSMPPVEDPATEPTPETLPKTTIDISMPSSLCSDRPILPSFRPEITTGTVDK